MMKPLRLKIKGLNSFIEEQEIDFDKLTEYGIFGIFGKTGSGKTTVIDAMTLALYGEIARFDKKPERQFVNMNSPEARVELTFQISAQGAISTYVAERIYKNPNIAKTKRSEKDSFVRLYKIDDGQNTVIADKENEVTKKIEKIIGLKYSDFVRSVILPQGKFNEFLLLENKERRMMLQRIFGFERYGEQLLKRVSEKRKIMTVKLEEAENSISRFGDLSKEKIAEVKQSLLDEDKKLAVARLRMSEILKELEDMLKVRELGNEYAAYAKELDELKPEEAQIKSSEVLLESSHRAAEVMQIIKLVNDRRKMVWDIEQKLSSIIKKENAAASEYATINERLNNVLQEKEQLYPELIRFEERLSNAKRLDDEIKEYQKERQKLLVDYGEATEKLKKTEIRAEKLRARLKLLNENISAAQNELSGMEVTFEHREKISKCAEIYRKLDELSAKNKSVETKLKSYADNKELMKKSMACEEKDNNEIQNKVATLNNECERLREKLNMSAKAKYENAVSLLVMDMKDGEPCPICGSTEHPYIANANISSNIQELLSESNVANWEKQLADKEAERSKMTIKLSIIMSNMAKITESLKNIEVNIKEFDAEIKSYCEQKKALALEIKGISKEFATDTDRIKAEMLKLRKNDEVRPELQKKLTALLCEQNKVKSELEESSIEIVAHKGNIQVICQSGMDKKALIEKKTEEIQKITGGTHAIDKRIELLQKEKNSIVRTCEKISREAERAEKEWQSAAECRKDLQSQRKTLDELLRGEEQRLDEIIRLKGFSGVPEVETAFMPEDKQKNIELRLKNYYDRLDRISINIERLSKKQGFELVSDREQGDEINRKVVKLEAEREATVRTIENSIKNIGKFRSDIENMEKQLGELNETKRRLKVVQSEADILADMASLLRGAEFVEYLSRKQLAFLTDVATRKLLKMTSGRYALELDDRDFTIRDNHNGGKRRHPRTLSGGEAFTTSLCLALALSMKIQMSKNASMEFFFLDEGFGMLDKAALDTVFDALEQLRMEKIKVGVISHVEELKIRLPSILYVEPAGNGTGSRILIGEF